MDNCVDWVDEGGLSFALICNSPGCPHRVGPLQPTVCDCCDAKIPKVEFSYGEPGPRVFACGHEEKFGDFGLGGQFGCCVDYRLKCPDCLGWERVPINPSPIIGDFSKFTMPMIRPQHRAGGHAPHPG